MKHRHHIVPKHRGGTDDPSNLVEVTPTQHAMWHFAEWQLNESKWDWLAWKALSGLIPCSEVAVEAQRLGGVSSFEKKVGCHSEKAKEKSRNTQKRLIELGLHSLQNPEMRAMKAKIDSEKRKAEWENGTNPLQREDVVVVRKVRSSQSRSSQNSTQVTCPHCGKTGGHTNMKRYHFDRCKTLLASRPSII